MPKAGIPTFDQLQIFLAVAETGSFAGASRKLNRAVSVVSYGIDGLEAQLGLALFERQGTRKPKLTAAGRVVLAEARTLTRDMESLRAKATGLLQGLEAEVDVAIDVMLPTERVGRVLHAFRLEFPTVLLRMHVETLGAVTAMVLEGTASVGISGPLAAGVEQVERIPAGSVPMVPFASPIHPLGQMKRIPPGEARKYIQLVLTDRSRFTEGRDFSVTSPHTWRMADLGAKHALLREGIGWGNMPQPLVQADLDAGKLKRLAIPDHPGGTYRFHGIWRRDTPPGPAASWLLSRFAEIGREDAEEEGLADV